jgi:holo-[acyl-carrier protein] synthase
VIYGVGTDIVQVARIQRSLEQYGERFARRILADEEFGHYQRVTNKAHFLAKRFAAKEALAKAFGTGFRNGLHLRHIVVTHDSLGKPMLKCLSEAQRLASECGVSQMHLSLSDERDYAVAMVVLEK